MMDYNLLKFYKKSQKACSLQNYSLLKDPNDDEFCLQIFLTTTLAFNKPSRLC